MQASEECKDAIKVFENCKLRAYKCPAGVWTIGVGHTRGVRRGQIITQAQAEVLLKGDLLSVEKYLNGLGMKFTQGQFDALADFCFNLGISKFRGSTLYNKVLSHASDDDIVKEFGKWVYARKRKLSGLVKRREWEAERWIRK